MNSSTRRELLDAVPITADALPFVHDVPTLDGFAEGRAAFPPVPDTRSFAVYEPHAAFKLVDELDFLSRRSIDQNVFFTPQFLVPAMPRLDDRSIRLLVARDEGAARSRLRLLMPFSVERAGLVRSVSILRVWTHPFGPTGTLPVDSDDPDGTLASLLDFLRRPEGGWPGILVLPHLRIDGAMPRAMRDAAERAGLPVAITDRYDRAALCASGEAGAFRDTALSAKRHREFRRQHRLLERAGPVRLEVAVEPDAVREALEDFLALEAGGWKGRTRSAMVLDRYRAAFAREAVNGLAAKAQARVFTLHAGAEVVASLVVLVCEGEAVAWKSAYDERFAAASPGFLLLVLASEALVADPAIRRVDSCAVPDHFVMNQVWRDRVRIATLVIGLSPGSAEKVAFAAAALSRARRLSHLSRRIRDRAARLLGLGR